MNIERFEIKGLVLFQPRVFKDERGYFMETYNKNVFAEAGIDVNFVQDNASHSAKGVIRGIHFQRPPHAQDKLVRVVRGEVLDVAVDLRTDSPTYGTYQTVILSEENRNIFFIPKGFAHGFSVLSDVADFEYKVSDFYHPECEGGIIWNDPDLAINWKVRTPIIGKKDMELPALKNV
jgi:dTDP-4-dehydrorhamnose 3,5-epimerase